MKIRKQFIEVEEKEDEGQDDEVLPMNIDDDVDDDKGHVRKRGQDQDHDDRGGDEEDEGDDVLAGAPGPSERKDNGPKQPMVTEISSDEEPVAKPAKFFKQLKPSKVCAFPPLPPLCYWLKSLSFLFFSFIVFFFMQDNPFLKVTPDEIERPIAEAFEKKGEFAALMKMGRLMAQAPTTSFPNCRTLRKKLLEYRQFVAQRKKQRPSSKINDRYCYEAFLKG